MMAPLDIVFFFGSLVAVMGIGLWAARNENTTEDFFLAGRSVRWWGVTGSIFGSNVSAAHLVGMLGIGYSIGFAQSHFELGAIAALMLLAYGFLPIYRKLGLFTLSEYLGKRYDDRSRTLYSLILLVVAVVQLTAAFYIGSRSLGLLLEGTRLEVGYATGVVVLAVVTAVYTIVGGLKAVIYTDVIQSVLLLFAGILVAILTFAQPEVGGWSGMMEFDQNRSPAEQKMHLYLPSDHPDLPWSGALTGLLILHCFYWSTNQTIVQRALAAKSDREARLGIVAAGFLKLLIPFFTIAGGVAAAQLFELRMPDRVIDPDAATPELIRLVVPMGFGLVGVVMAGLIGAILSSIDSLVNSASTLVTFDLYKKYLRPDASDRECLNVGKVVLAVLLAGSALMALATYDPNSSGNFFLRVSSQAGHFTPGLVVAFGLGMFWRKATAAGAAASIVLSPVFSFAVVAFYRAVAANNEALLSLFGSELNFMHRVFLTVLFALLVHILASKLGSGGENATFTAFDLGGFDPSLVSRVFLLVFVMALAALGLGMLVWQGLVATRIAAFVAVGLGILPFVPALRERWTAGAVSLGDDLPWSALLCGVTMAMMFLFF